MNELAIVDNQTIQNKIFTIRNTQVMIDRDLAELYGVETRSFNQAVKRNINRFPIDFRFQLSETEYENLRSQFVTSSFQHGGRRYLPYAFTEQGVSMLSAILKSDIAVDISIKIVREFINMRKFISQNNSLFNKMNILEEKQKSTDQKVDDILNAIESKNTTIKQGVFFEGQFFDAYAFVSDILKEATQSIVLMDNYVDETTLVHLCAKSKSGVSIKIITKKISKELQLDVEKYNKQYNGLTVYEYKNSHDRFLIMDNKIIYHIGASLKDLGNKWFAFSKFEDDNLELLEKINKIMEGKLR